MPTIKKPEPDEDSPSKPPVSARGVKPAAPQLGEDDVAINATGAQKRKRAEIDARTKYPLNEVKGDHVEKL